MKLTTPSARRLSPGRLLQLYLFVVLAIGGGLVGVVLILSGRVNADAAAAARASAAAIEAARIQAGLAEPTTVLSNALVPFLQGAEFAALPPAEKAQLTAVLTGAEPAAPASLPDVPLRLPEREAIRFNRSVDFYSHEVDNLLLDAPEVDLSQVKAARDSLLAALEAYLDRPTAANFAALHAGLLALGRQLQEGSAALAARAETSRSDLADLIADGSTFLLATLLAATLLGGGVTLTVGGLIHGAFVNSRREKEELEATTARLRHRNEQLNALYNVFAEITDTLSLRYVINATLREASSLMGADAVVLRLLKGDELVVAGSLRGNNEEVQGLDPVPLGFGPTGRAARRGRTLRIDRDAWREIGQGSKTTQSGIVVPLIVGARVVGTLAVWSREPEKFSEEDERILEMMASQVATAVVAADTTETSVQRAHQDPLTGLPNRLQLAEDCAGALAEMVRAGRRAVVAMADIDRFKRFNDDFGHKVGDITLQQVASILRHAVRDHDRIYRFGGEEFVFVFMDIGPMEGLALAERVRNAIATTPFSGDQMEPVGPVTISIGLAAAPEHGSDLNALIGLADKAMYQAKQAGRNQVKLWQEESATSATAA